MRVQIIVCKVRGFNTSDILFREMYNYVISKNLRQVFSQQNIYQLSKLGLVNTFIDIDLLEKDL